MVVVELYSDGLLLSECQCLASVIPQLTTVGCYLGGYDTIEDDDAVRSQDGEYLLHDVLQLPPMTTDEYGVRMGQGADVLQEEVAYMNADAGSSKAAGILLNDGFALRTYFESLDL